MKTHFAAFVLLSITACSTLGDEQEIEATRDFVVANQLKEVDAIRLHEQLNYRIVNHYFVTVDTRRGDYLVEFRSRCRALTQREFQPHMVDFRRDTSHIRARFDTIRGCVIGKIYEVTKDQREELRNLGDAPGQEIFLPDDEQNDTAADAREAATDDE